MKALLLIDIQNDFCPGGALAVNEGDQVVNIANEWMGKVDLVVATKDWHPADHGSFAAMYQWRKPGQVIDLNGLPQILWPTHCVQNTFGSEFHKHLDIDKINMIFYKGTDQGIDSYSGFYDNGKTKSTGMGEWLQSQGVTEVYILGLATDYCVKFSALDALGFGFKTKLIVNGCRGVNLQEGDVEKALEEMKNAGVEML